MVWGSIATESDGSGKSSGGRITGCSRDDSVSPVSVAVSLATAPISPACELADRLLVLAVEQQELADPLVLVAVGVPGVGLAVERAAQDPEVGQAADERVGGGLEHPGDERAVRVRRDRDGLVGPSRRGASTGGSSAAVGR